MARAGVMHAEFQDIMSAIRAADVLASTSGAGRAVP